MAEVTKKKNTTVRKKTASEAQRRANVMNSRKSTGPITSRGKNICKYANLQHGLRAETVLPGEEQTYAQRFAKWSEEQGADDDSQRFLVHRAVMSSLRLDRGDVADVAMVGEHRDAVIQEADLRAGDALDRLVAQLADSPAATIRRLRNSPSGCAWIHEQLLMLKTRLENHQSLLDSQRRRLCNLLGRRIEDFLCDDPTIVPWVIEMVGCLFGGEEVDLPSLAGVFGGQPQGMTAAEFTTRLRELGPAITDGKEANLKLRDRLTGELARLKTHLELVEALAAQRLEREVNSTQVVLTPAGKQLDGYITSQRQSFDSSFRRLAALQDPRRPRPPGRTPKPGPGPGDDGSPAPTETPSAPREPRAADAEVAPAAVATEDHVAVAAEAPSGDGQPLVETTPEVPALEPAGEGALEPAEDKKTTRPILERKSSNEPDFDEKTTPADSGGEPPGGPGAPGVAAEPTSGAGAKEPDFKRFGPYAQILRNVHRNLEATDGDQRPTDPDRAGSDSPLARATEQFRLRQIELSRQYDEHFGIDGNRPEPGGAAPVSERVEEVPRDPVPGRPEPASMPLKWPKPVAVEGSANLSPLAKGGYRGVLERRDPEDPGLEFTPPAPPS
jgi:hypothetical protein